MQPLKWKRILKVWFRPSPHIGKHLVFTSLSVEFRKIPQPARVSASTRVVKRARKGKQTANFELESLRQEAMELKRKLALLEGMSLENELEQYKWMDKEGQCAMNSNSNLPHRHSGTAEVSHEAYLEKQSKRAEHKTPNTQNGPMRTKRKRQQTKRKREGLSKERHPSMIERHVLKKKILRLPSENLPELAKIVADAKEIEENAEIELDLSNLNFKKFDEIQNFVDKILKDERDSSSSEDSE